MKKIDILQYVDEELQLKIISYLTSHYLITLCFVSKYYRKLVLNKYVKYHDLSTSVCSVKYWRTRIEKNLFILHEQIHDNFDCFYFEESYFEMCKKFRHLSLFSVCLHLLTCKRSCEKKINSYCRLCSRMRANNFFDMDKFQDLVMCYKRTPKDDS